MKPDGEKNDITKRRDLRKRYGTLTKATFNILEHASMKKPWLQIIKQCSLTLAAVITSITSFAQPIDPHELEAYLDGVIESRMESFNVAGVTVSVVHQGETLLAKGYGIADNDGRLVTSENTLFRPGSISKTFTWTAVMQLVEQGKLDLNAPIQQYVPEINLPEEFGIPITMAHLMTHRPGLEDGALGHLFENNPDEVKTLTEYLQNYPMAQVRAPGTLPAYSNWGSALAGLAVANISGQRFEDYIEDHILLPLQMTSSTFREPWAAHLPDPMPEDLHTRLSKGMARELDAWTANKIVFISQLGPAGALSTTSTDMARFMLAHLNDGSLGDAQILEPETARRMHSALWRPSDQMAGNFHGFLETRLNGYSGYGHSGATLYFMSDMLMIPELSFGYFISTNSSGGSRLIDGLGKLLVERFFPSKTRPNPKPPADFLERSERYNGQYIGTRRSYTQVEAIQALLGVYNINISAEREGYLLIHQGEDVGRFVEISPDTFQRVDSQEIVSFDENERGEIVGLPTTRPVVYFERLGLLNNPNIHLSWIVLSLLIFLVTLVRFNFKELPSIFKSNPGHPARLSVLTMSALWILFFTLGGIYSVNSLADLNQAIFEFPSALFIGAMTVSSIATIETFRAAILLWPLWAKGIWTRRKRIRHSLLVALGLGVYVILNHYNAIGYHWL